MVGNRDCFDYTQDSRFNDPTMTAGCGELGLLSSPKFRPRNPQWLQGLASFDCCHSLDSKLETHNGYRAWRFGLLSQS